jgi:hypothetical protein
LPLPDYLFKAIFNIINAIKPAKGVQNVIDRGIQFFVNTNCKPDKDMNYTPIGIDPKKAFLDARGGVHLRNNTEVNKNNLAYCKNLMKIVDELRPSDHTPVTDNVTYSSPELVFSQSAYQDQAALQSSPQESQSQGDFSAFPSCLRL